MRQAPDAKVTMSVLVEVADMQAVVPKLVKEAAKVLGDEQGGFGDDQFYEPIAAAWVPSQPDWLVTAERAGHRVKVTNVRTGAMVCKLGGQGGGDGGKKPEKKPKKAEPSSSSKKPSGPPGGGGGGEPTPTPSSS